MHLLLTQFRYFPWGGAQRDMYNIANAARARGHRVEIFTTAWQDERPADTTRLDVSLHQCSGITNHRRMQHFSAAICERRKGVDVVLGFNKTAGLDWLFCADDCLAEQLNGKILRHLLPRYRTYLKLEGQALNCRAGTLFLTSAQQQVYRRWYPDSTGDEVLPPTGYQPISPQRSRAAVRADLGIAEDQFLVLSVAAAPHTKGLDLGIRTLAGLATPQRHRVRMMIAGTSEHRYTRLAHRVGIGAQLLGPVAQPADLYCAADLLLHPARREAAGKVLLEAMAAGLPIIASANCGYAPLVSDSGAGLCLPPPFDERVWSGATARLMEDRSLREQMAANGRDWAQRYPPSGLAKAVLDTIEARHAVD